MFKIFSNSDSIKNPAFITQWSIMHFSLGLVFYIYMFYFFGIKDINSFKISNLIHGIYEFNDLLQYLGWKKQRLWNWGNNSLINSIGDTLVFNIGWLIGYYIKENINCNIMYIITIFYCLLFYYLYRYDLEGGQEFFNYIQNKLTFFLK